MTNLLNWDFTHPQAPIVVKGDRVWIGGRELSKKEVQRYFVTEPDGDSFIILGPDMTYSGMG